MTDIDRAHPTPTPPSDGGLPPSLPHPAGLPPEILLRPYAGPADHPGMVAANNAWRETAGFIDFVDVPGMDVQYANIPRFQPGADCVVLERAGSIVGYARVEWADARDGERLHAGIVIAPPGPDRPARIAALLDWCARRSSEQADIHPTERPRVLDAVAPIDDEQLTAALLDRGYVAVRHGYEMIRPDLEAIPDVPLPAGLEVRPVLPEHLRAIYEAELEAFRDHWGAFDDEGDRFEQFRSDPHNDLSLWRVAWDGEQVAGMVRSYIDPATNARTGRLTGWTEHISVRRPWRRRGLARALLAESLRAVRDRGMTDASLGVDAGNENGALRLYESMGFRVAQDHVTYHRPLEDGVQVPAGSAEARS